MKMHTNQISYIQVNCECHLVDMDACLQSISVLQLGPSSFDVFLSLWRELKQQACSLCQHRTPIYNGAMCEPFHPSMSVRLVRKA